MPYPMTTAESGSYARLANEASAFIKSYIGRPLLSGSLQTEYFSGDCSTQYYTQCGPITSSTVKLEFYSGTPSDPWYNAVDDRNMLFEVEKEAGRVYFVDGNRFFNSCAVERNWRITYEFGYDGVENIPQDLKLQTILLVKYYKAQSEKIGIVSESNGAGSAKTVYTGNIPVQITDALDKYVRYVN